MGAAFSRSSSRWLPLVGLWALAWAAVHFGYWWLSLPLAVPAAGLLVRLFMIQHDCGHGAFFRHRLANDWVGRVLGVLTLTPYDAWRRSHAVHHASSGNLDRRGIGDIDTLTVNEYLAPLAARPSGLSALSASAGDVRRWSRLSVRRPASAAGRIDARRLAAVAQRHGDQFAIAALVGTLIWLVGVGAFLLVQVPVTLLAATMGVWLFYVQHQFEHTHWDEQPQLEHA